MKTQNDFYKGGSLYSHFPRNRRNGMAHRHMEWHWVQSEGRGSPRQTEAGGAFIVVFIRKNGYRGVSRFRIGWFEKCQMNASQ